MVNEERKMNKAAVFHEPNSRYCFAISENELVIRLRLAKEDRQAQVELVYGMKYEYHQKQESKVMTFVGYDHLFAYYEVVLSLMDVRLAYVFQISQGQEVLYFSEGGFFSEYDFELGYQTYFQMPYINAVDIHRPVEWMGQGTFYQIFIDRFARGDFDKDDSYITMKWLSKPNTKSFAGGDLAGISRKLDYLEDLGITALYLTPIFQSISNHKYDINDYFTVDSQFGNVFDLRILVEQAHLRGIKVVLDAVFNHSSDLLPEFQDVVKNGRSSKYFDWFMVDGDVPQRKPLNYETFASVTNMPKWNTSNPEVRDYLIGVAEYWMKECQIDGWRLDVSDEVSQEFWRCFKRAVKKINPDAVIIGENWHDAYPNLRGDQFDSIMNYAFSKAVLTYVSQEKLDGQQLVEDLTNLRMRNTWQVNKMNLNLLDSHDTHRILTQLGGDKNALLIALAILLTFEGSPCIYYGTEIAMEGGYDPDCRRGFDWEQVSDDNVFFNRVKQLINVRKNEKTLHCGKMNLSEKDNVFLLQRSYGDIMIELRINGGLNPIELSSEDVLFEHLVEDGKVLSKGFVLLKYPIGKELAYE